MAPERKNKKGDEKDKRMKTSVVITLLNDFRVKRTIESLLKQERIPDEIIIADGGSHDELMTMLLEYERKYNIVKVHVLPGSVAETRNKVLPLLNREIIVFLDADEIAPPHWLANIVAPIERGEVDFVGGPTKPFAEAKNRCEKFINEYSKWFYENVVSNDISMLPMGNTAWHRKIFDKIGGFDERLKWGGEDYDVNLRALASGFRGKLVKDAWVWHDQSHLNSLKKIFKKKYKYAIGATLSYFKSKEVDRKIGRAAKTSIRYLHPIEAVNLFIKPLAFVKGYMIWRKINQT
ncbi:MAG TPA: glycosyltransferase [Thermoplasmata archaeon]|nr:glycosyltransferase [Thermoplasmata archaeon]